MLIFHAVVTSLSKLLTACFYRRPHFFFSSVKYIFMKVELQIFCVGLPTKVHPLEISIRLLHSAQSFSINWNGCCLWAWDAPNHSGELRGKKIKNCEMLAWSNFIIAFTDVLPFAKGRLFLTCYQVKIRTLKKWKTTFLICKVLVQVTMLLLLVQTNQHNHP